VTKIGDLHRRWRKDADYKEAYDALGEAFDLERSPIDARTAAALWPWRPAGVLVVSQARIATRQRS
jgi:hypothetical protein